MSTDLQPVLLKTEKDFATEKDRKELLGTEKDFYLIALCYFNTCLRTFNIIVVLISDCIIAVLISDCIIYLQLTTKL